MTQRSSATARRDSNTHSSLNTDMREDQDGQTEDDIAAGDYGSGNSATLKDFSTVYGTVRNYKKFAWATPFLVAGEVAMELLIPFLMAILIDRGVSARNMSEVWKWGIILVIVAFISLAFGIGAGKTSAVASAGLAKNLRHDLFRKVQGFSFTNIDRFSTGSLVTRLTTDVTNVQNAYQMLIRIAFRAPLMIIFAWLFTFRISPDISFIFLVVAPLLALVLAALGMSVHPIFVRVFRRYDRLNNRVEENLAGVRVVKS
ncbi:MAG: ABC transporter ATP-binding protein, partial [Scardovia wiggsiae]|nr:ABC transporter ATP-binding protein [Scardovia wiggsiae]